MLYCQDGMGTSDGGSFGLLLVKSEGCPLEVMSWADGSSKMSMAHSSFHREMTAMLPSFG